MRTNPALRVFCATCNSAAGAACSWGDGPHDARIWLARSILGAPVIAAASTPPAEAKRRSKRASPRPAQLDLPLDWTEAMGISLARFEVPAAETPIQSPAAAAVTEMVEVAHQAMRGLEKKTRRKKVAS